MRLETHISSKHNGCMNDYFVILNGQDMTAVCITWIGSNTNTGPGVYVKLIPVIILMKNR